MQTRSLLFAVTFFTLAGCADLSEEKAAWEASNKDWAAKLEKIKKGHGELATKVKAFAVPAGEAALETEKATLDKSIETGTAALAEAEHHLAEAKTEIDALIAKGKKVPLEVALSGQKAEVDGAIAKAQSLVSASSQGLDMLSAKVAAAKGAGEAAKSRAEAWMSEAKKKGGLLAIDDIVFNVDAVDLEKSKVSLASLLTTLKSCADLKVELSVTALGEAADLGSKRAEALKAYLTANGVNAAVLAKVAGSVLKEGEEKVAVAITTPCK